MVHAPSIGALAKTMPPVGSRCRVQVVSVTTPVSVRSSSQVYLPVMNRLLVDHHGSHCTGRTVLSVSAPSESAGRVQPRDTVPSMMPMPRQSRRSRNNCASDYEHVTDSRRQY
jgi:hypothetical protein